MEVLFWVKSIPGLIVKMVKDFSLQSVSCDFLKLLQKTLIPDYNVFCHIF